MDSHDSPTPKGERPTESTVVSYAKALPLTVIITALLYYFGAARTQHVYEYFGVDASMLNYSVADYLIRSLALYPALVSICVAFLGAVWAFQGIVYWINRTKHAKSLPVWLAVAGVAFMVMAEIFRRMHSTYWSPALGIIGILLVLGAIYVYHEIIPQLPPWLVILSSGICLVILLLNGFYLLSDHAICSAKAGAKALFIRLDQRPVVTIARRSQTDLSTFTSTLTYSDTAFAYPSMKLLAASDGKYFLVPATGTITSSTTYIFDPDSTALIKLTRGDFPECRWPNVEIQ